ncbi:anti-sigma factor [Streptomyces vinaceus]|uniref:anti-sigma factor n=1 Tax=Streptomyces vinaceus TaxID=1960 RepID=UPI0038022ED2
MPSGGRRVRVDRGTPGGGRLPTAAHRGQGTGHVCHRRRTPASAAHPATLGGVAVWQTQNGQDLKQRTRQAQQQLDEVSAVLAAPDPRTVHSRAADGALTTVVASDRQNKAVFTAAGLPATAAGKTYQLWLDHHGTMSPAGLIDHDGTAVLTGNPAGAAAIGLALEPAGGSSRPTTEPLFLMTLPA